jgi:hypothetical protein
MPENARIWGNATRGLAAAVAAGALGLAGCATTEPGAPDPPGAAPVAKAIAEKPAPDPRALAEEARALVAQAETDIQRARVRRALWAKAWESLVGARAAMADSDSAGAIRLARRASEFAQLGLEQLAYPAVK